MWPGEGTHLCWTSSWKKRSLNKSPAGSLSLESRHFRVSLKLKGTVAVGLVLPCPPEWLGVKTSHRALLFLSALPPRASHPPASRHQLLVLGRF